MKLSENPLALVIRQEQNRREKQEDSFLALPLLGRLAHKPLWLLAVADGIGGRQAGEEMSRETLFKIGLSLFQRFCLEPALNTLSAAPSLPPAPVELRGALQEILPLVNAHIRRLAKANQWRDAGATVTVALLSGEDVVISNLGDSPLFHFQAAANRLIRRSQEHTIASALLEEGLITPEMAHYHEGRHMLEFFVGAENLPPEIPIASFALAGGDIVLLCSDGVAGSLAETAILTILADSSLTLAQKADRLLRAGQEAGATDNQTLILWEHLGDQGDDSASLPVYSGTVQPLEELPTTIKKDEAVTVQSSTSILTELLAPDSPPSLPLEPEPVSLHPIPAQNTGAKLKVKNSTSFIAWLVGLISKLRRATHDHSSHR